MPKTKTKKRATPNNPQFNLLDPAAWDEFLSGVKSDSGIKITRKTAMSYAAFWRGVTLVSSAVGKIPMFVLRRVGNGKERATDHPCYKLLRYRPNEYMTAFIFKQTLCAHLLVEGNAYAFIDRDGAGRPVSLLPMSPDATYPVRANGILYYVTSVQGASRKMPADSVLHWRGLGFDGLLGYSVIEYGKQSLGLGLAAEKYGAIFFGNNAQPSVVLEHPGRLGPKGVKNLRESWTSMHMGLDRQHRLAVLEEGMKLHPFSSTAKDAQLNELRGFEIRNIANWLGVPPHKLGDSSRVAYNSLEQENQDFLSDGLDPRMVPFEEECREKLLSEEEKNSDSHMVEFERNAFVRSDMAARANYFRAALAGAPWMTVNEVRGVDNRNPIEGGDVMRNPLNMAPQGERDPADGNEIASDVPTGDKEESANRATAKRILMDTLGRMTRRLATQARRATKDPSQYAVWLAEARRKNESVVAEALRPAAIVNGMDPDGLIERFFARAAAMIPSGQEWEVAGMVAKLPGELCNDDN